MDKKYANLVNHTDIEIATRLHRFTPEIAEKILELSNKETVGQYQLEDWEKLAEYCKEHRVFELSLTAIKLAEIPIKQQLEIMNSMFGSEKASILSSNYIMPATIEKLRDAMGNASMQNYMLNVPNIMSQMSLYILCTRAVDVNDKVWSRAWSLITDENMASSFLPDILDDKDTSLGQSADSEEFLYAISSNVNLSDDIRNKAFDLCTPENLPECPTNHMMQVKYEQLASSIFEVKNVNGLSDTLKGTIQNNAENALKNLVFKNVLPESCQLDYIERYKADKTNGNESILELMSKHTEYPSVLISLLQTDKSLKKSVANNATAIDKKVMREMHSSTHPDFLTRVYIKHLFQHPTDKAMLTEMLSANESGLATRMAVICSPKQFSGINYQLNELQDGLEEADKRKLLFLNKIKNALMAYSANEYILYKTAYNLFSETDECKHRSPNSAQSELLSELNTGKKCEAMNTHAYANIKLSLFEIEKEFPEKEFQNEIKRIRLEAKNIHRASQIAIDYPNLFKPIEIKNRMFPEPLNNMQSIGIPSHLPIKTVNAEELLKMSDEDIKVLTAKLLAPWNDDYAKVICRYLEYTLNCIPNHEADKRFVLLYRFNDMYNKAKDAIENNRSLKEEVRNDDIR